MKGVDLFDHKGKKIGEIEIEKQQKEEKKVSKRIVSLVNFHYLSNKKQETKKTKNRSEVNASTRKIYRQKGTGGARHGARSAPQFKGGGVAFGPRGIKSKNLKINKKFKKLSFLKILKEKIERKEVIVVNKIEVEKYKTREANSIINNILMGSDFFRKEEKKLGKKIFEEKKKLVILSEKEEEREKLKRIFKNINNLRIIESNNLNPFYLISNRWIFFTKKAFSEKMKIK